MLFRSLAALSALAAVASAAIPTCGGGSKCAQDTPCCSQYGQCGVGAYCLGGCDPINSFSLDSCMPAPVCKSITSNFNTGYKGLISKDKYLGDATQSDWVAEGQPVFTSNELLLTMAPETVGTLVASTGYVWYGKMTAVMRTSHGAGVVTAFILLGDTKDEIDYEFVGTQLTTAQTNFYYHGIPDYTHSANISLADTFNNYHTYVIDWKPDSITWSVDGQVGRTLKRTDTWNKTANRYDFPSTPSRVQLSLWPGGASTNAKGTVDWAGGPIDWQSSLMQPQNYYYASFKSVQIECYDPPSGTQVNGSKSYVLGNAAANQADFSITNKGTTLKSFLGSGLDPNKGSPTGAAASATATVETIPGLSGAGSGADGSRGGSGTSGSVAAGSGSGTTFTQGGTSTKNGATTLLTTRNSAVCIVLLLLAALAL